MISIPNYKEERGINKNKSPDKETKKTSQRLHIKTFSRSFGTESFSE